MAEIGVQQAPGLATLPAGEPPAGKDDSLSRCYSDALGSIREIFRAVERGGVPETAPLLAVAQSLAQAALRDPAALLGITVTDDADSYSLQHSANVGVLATALAAALGQSLPEVAEAGMAGFLHDVGKTQIDQAIVGKPGKLTEREYEEMKLHPEYGALIILQMKGVHPRVAEGVLGHHIRFDRGGYPEWARGRGFGAASGIVAVADCYDATTTHRAYQPQMRPVQAVEEIRSQGGTSLDGEVVRRFLELAGRFPAGSLVRLDSNEIALVLTPSSHACGAATVKVVRDGCGAELAHPQLLSLAQSGARIVGLVDPLGPDTDAAC